MMMNGTQKYREYPDWWLALYRKITARDFTGSVTLHCKEGQVLNQDERRVGEPKILNQSP